MVYVSYRLLLLLALAGFFSLQAEEDIDYCDDSDTPRVVTLTLESAINRAVEANRQFVSSLEAVQKSQFALEIAESDFDIKITPNGEAGFAGGTYLDGGPKYGGGIDFYKRFQQGTRINFSPSLHKRNRHFHTDLNAMLVQPILRGFGRDYTMNGVYNAEYGVRTAVRSLYSAQVALIMRTIQSLYDIVRAEEMLRLQKESYDRLKGYYNAAKLKEKIGLSDALDVYRAESEVKHAEEALNAAQVRFQDSQDTLKDLLVLPFDSTVSIKVPLIYNEIRMTPEEAVEVAIENRIEMEQSYDAYDESQRAMRIAKDNLYPELNLILNYNNSGADEIFHRSCFAKRQNIWSVGFSTSSDFNQIAQNAAYQQSVIGIISTRRGVDQTEANITLEVKKSLRNLDQIFKKIALQKEQIHTANGELKLSLLKFNRGFANNFDVIQAEKALRSAEITLFNSVVEHIIGQYQLMATLGILADKPIISRACN